MGKPHQLRIIGGQWRRRRIPVLDKADLRPTSDRVRETLFNWLGQTLNGKNCLDLFAGSGALGLEAASRGADSVVMVENERDAYRNLTESVRQLGAASLEKHSVETYCQDAFAFLATNRRVFDVIFLDPPYRLDLLPRLLGMLQPHMARSGVVYIEAEQLPEIPSEYAIVRRSRAGRVNFLLLEFAHHDNTL